MFATHLLSDIYILKRTIVLSLRETTFQLFELNQVCLLFICKCVVVAITKLSIVCNTLERRNVFICRCAKKSKNYVMLSKDQPHMCMYTHNKLGCTRTGEVRGHQCSFRFRGGHVPLVPPPLPPTSAAYAHSRLPVHVCKHSLKYQDPEFETNSCKHNSRVHKNSLERLG